MFIDNQGLFLFKYINTSVRLRNMETDWDPPASPSIKALRTATAAQFSVFRHKPDLRSYFG